jgi:hypothetical protein
MIIGAGVVDPRDTSVNVWRPFTTHHNFNIKYITFASHLHTYVPDHTKKGCKQGSLGNPNNFHPVNVEGGGSATEVDDTSASKRGVWTCIQV